MRAIGSLHPTEGIPSAPDVVGTVAGSSAGAVMTQDYPSAAAATGSSRPHIMRITASVPVYFQNGSTGASIPSTTSTPGSTLNSALILTERWYQVPGGSTGYSIAFPTTGFATIEFFRRASP